MSLSQLPIDRQSFWPNDSLHTDVFVLDVRTPAEFIEAHIPGSINVPLGDLGGREAEIAEHAGSRNVAILCRTGRRAETARKKLAQQGLESTGVMQGGIVNWQSKGLPVNRGPKAFTIDRQVRIAAGFLVLLGVVLGMTVHQGFVGLS
ncbi:MAG: rhodanese-like domain-containing protein, partial [bacterium]